eukprot:363845-Chlamydomonas_euryale.AAC.2
MVAACPWYISLKADKPAGMVRRNWGFALRYGMHSIERACGLHGRNLDCVAGWPETTDGVSGSASTYACNTQLQGPRSSRVHMEDVDRHVDKPACRTGIPNGRPACPRPRPPRFARSRLLQPLILAVCPTSGPGRARCRPGAVLLQDQLVATSHADQQWPRTTCAYRSHHLVVTA